MASISANFSGPTCATAQKSAGPTNTFRKHIHQNTLIVYRLHLGLRPNQNAPRNRAINFQIHFNRHLAADFTRLAPGLPLTEAELELIGFYSPYLSTGGPGTLQPTRGRRVAYAEVTPRRLLEVDEGELLAALSPTADDGARALASTFKVVRAVSECECIGYLDQINAYDDAGISYGPCHWAMADAITTPKGSTELGGLAAYLRYLSEGDVVHDVVAAFREAAC